MFDHETQQPSSKLYKVAVLFQFHLMILLPLRIKCQHLSRIGKIWFSQFIFLALNQYTSRVLFPHLNREHPQSWREQKITDRHFGCHWNLNIIINFHIYKGQSGTFMETVTALGMSLSRILFGWQEHLDTMAWQDVSATVLPTGGEAPGSGFGVLVLEKSSPVRILSSDSEESDCLGWKNQNPKTSPAWLASLVLAGSARTDQSGRKTLGRIQNRMYDACGQVPEFSLSGELLCSLDVKVVHSWGFPLMLLNRMRACGLEDGFFINSPPFSVDWGRMYYCHCGFMP